MSSRTEWCSKTVPLKIKQLYGTDYYEKLQEYVRARVVKWRYSGTTHFELRHLNDEKPTSLTLGTTATMPVYKAKLRQAIRRWDGWREPPRTDQPITLLATRG